MTCSTLTASTISSINFPDGKVQNSSAIGYGQTYNNVTASRALNTAYTNSTGRPIFVFVSGNTSQNTSASFTAYINTVNIGLAGVCTNASYGAGIGLTFIVPAGSTYYVVGSSAGSALTLTTWFELS